MTSWYVLQVSNGKENEVFEFINKCNVNEVIPLIFRVECFKKKAGEYFTELKILFPGYVFIETNSNNQIESTIYSKIVNKNNNIYSLIGNKDNRKVSEYEKAQLLRVVDENYVVRKSIGCILNKEVEIISGPLRGFENYIRKINIHKKMALVEMKVLGGYKVLRYPLEIICKGTV